MGVEFVSLKYEDGIAILSLNHGVTNAISKELVVEIAGILPGIGANEEIMGLVITSANDKFFSIGFDIPHLYDMKPSEFRGFYEAFCNLCVELTRFPKPVVAAINGHAVAGGCILILCTDYRYIAKGKKLVGMNEIKLGVPVPYIADCTLRALVGHRKARLIMDSGNFYRPEEAYDLGLVDEIREMDELIPTSFDRVRKIAQSSLPAFSKIKQNRIEPIFDEFDKRKEAKQEEFIQLWYSKETRNRLKEAISKF